LKGHLRGALNGGATLREVSAVRDVVMKICEESRMKKTGLERRSCKFMNLICMITL
jgi:hypothetical protein